MISADLLLACYRFGGCRASEAGRPGRGEQGLVPGAGDAACGVRLPRQGHGSGRAADRAVQRHWRSRQTDSGTHRGCRSARHAQGTL